MAKKRKQSEPRKHIKGIGCSSWYDEQRKKRLCSCGRDGVGLDSYDVPVCHIHNIFPTAVVNNFPAMKPCPGPHCESIATKEDE